MKYSRPPDLTSSSNVSLQFAWVTGPTTDPRLFKKSHLSNPVKLQKVVSIQMQLEKSFWPIVSTVMDRWIVLAMDSVLCLGTLSVNTIEIHYLHH